MKTVLNNKLRCDYDKKNSVATTTYYTQEKNKSCYNHGGKNLLPNNIEMIDPDTALIDPDGKVSKKGDFVSFEPKSEHSSYTKNGCLVLVFMRGINKAI